MLLTNQNPQIFQRRMSYTNTTAQGISNGDYSLRVDWYYQYQSGYRRSSMTDVETKIEIAQKNLENMLEAKERVNTYITTSLEELELLEELDEKIAREKKILEIYMKQHPEYFI